MNTAGDEARLLEEELENYPEERDELLLEAAEAWRRAGNHDRAIELLTEATALEGEDGSTAKVVLADVLFELGRDDEAQAQLNALRKDWPDSPEPLHAAADLMRRRGEFDQALVWFDLAIARLDPDEVTDSYVTEGRRGVRRKLGLPPDALDDSVEHLERHMDEVVRQIKRNEPGNST